MLRSLFLALFAIALVSLDSACSSSKSKKNDNFAGHPPAGATTPLPEASSNILDPGACIGASLANGLAIVGGTPVCLTSLAAKNTVILYNGNGDQMCTATRIGPNHLLTAGHCTNHPIPGMKIGYVGALGGSAGAKTDAAAGIDPGLKVLAQIFHPLYGAVAYGGSDDKVYQDIGMVIFSGEMPVSITPIASFKDFPTTPSELRGWANPTLYKAGFGSHSDNDSSVNTNLLGVTLTVTSVDPLHGELSFKTGTKKGTCDGDSGGPGFLISGSTLHLVGVTSRGPDNSHCNDGNGIDTDARYFRGWLNCAAQKIGTLLGASAKLGPLRLSRELKDTSSNYCDKTVIATVQQFYQTAKKACAAKSGTQFEEMSGECRAVTQAACEADGGSWDAATKKCT